MKTQRQFPCAAWLAACALFLLSACRGPTPIAGRVAEITVTGVASNTPLPATPTASYTPTAESTATSTPKPADTVTPTDTSTPTTAPTPPDSSATATQEPDDAKPGRPTETPSPTPVVEIKAGKFTLKQVDLEANIPISNTIAPYVSFDGKFGAPYASFVGTHGPELFKDRVFQDEKGTIFVLPSGVDVAQQLAWLEKYSDIENVRSKIIRSSEYTPLGKGKVVMVGTGAVFVYPDGNYRTITAPKIVTINSSQSISRQTMAQFESKFPKIWWNEAWGTIVASDDNDMVISHTYNQVTNSWEQASLVDLKAQLKTPEQIYADWRQRMEASGSFVGYTPQEKEKLLQYFDALKYVKPEKTPQILGMFPWFHAPFSPDNPLRFLEDVQQIINNKGKGIWSGSGTREVKLDTLFDKGSRSEETQWWVQVSGLMKEAMTNRWMINYLDNFNKDTLYADYASGVMPVLLLQDLLDAKKDGKLLISNPRTRREIGDIIKSYAAYYNEVAEKRGWNPNNP